MYIILYLLYIILYLLYIILYLWMLYPGLKFCLLLHLFSKKTFATLNVVPTKRNSLSDCWRQTASSLSPTRVNTSSTKSSIGSEVVGQIEADAGESLFPALWCETEFGRTRGKVNHENGAKIVPLLWKRCLGKNKSVCFSHWSSFACLSLNRNLTFFFLIDINWHSHQLYKFLNSKAKRTKETGPGLFVDYKAARPLSVEA